MSTTANTAARELAEALGALFADYPMASPEAATLTLTVDTHTGRPLQIDGDPDQLVWLADLIRRGHQDQDRAQPGHPKEGVCAHCDQHEDAIHI
ncbi:hypothetical protein NE857_34020 (plasmid) [Nocardiopsis exhalans]|uniref:Uncharacterized protein n=1 Tax=Nocardiopsis exhalans TaxID=163604 RepID=A0ABY5DGT0_9ACTN|nr:hypothetical protein [Nocardiopsis exhalans]USY23551.1 hypothetical protein NE857_34020 [Nocardiopsis exhalans]